MENFYLTFGIKYPTEPHPYWTGADHSGWVRITAQSECFARLIAKQFFGDDWAFLYPEAHFDTTDSRRHFSKGELLHLKQLHLPSPRAYGYIVNHSCELAGKFKSPQEDNSRKSVKAFSGRSVLQHSD